ncbi:unnamed protein product [Soboliphyme baturini]|uniref:EF-hand domain-containing protein n=1 Tax=Soboliphyme baturini TaxID=241478 RepID=A0A183IRR1_9BILA|nr:unnamed protein product [Soboliphyme baturini]
MEEDAENLFTACDSMKKGYLSLEDLMRLCPTFTKEQAEQVLTLLDADNDGKVSKGEFIKGFQCIESAREAASEEKEQETARPSRPRHVNLLRRFSTEWNQLNKRNEDVFETSSTSSDQSKTIEELKSLISDIYKEIGDYIHHNEKVERQAYIEQLSELQNNVENQITRAMTVNKMAVSVMRSQNQTNN